MHTTLSEVTTDPSRHTLRVVIRVFADDFSKVVARGAHPSVGQVSDDAAIAYLRTTLVLTDAGGRTIPFHACGIKQTADLLWVCVETAPQAAVSGLKMRNRVLCELYDDQVNIVRSLLKSAPSSVLFTRNDAAKAIG